MKLKHSSGPLHHRVQTSPKFNEEVDIEPFLPLSQILMSLKSHIDPTKGIFVLVQQEYDDNQLYFYT